MYQKFGYLIVSGFSIFFHLFPIGSQDHRLLANVAVKQN